MAESKATGFVIDLRNYKDRQGSRLPEGDYRVKITDANITKTKTDGSVMVEIFLVVANGPQQGKALMDRLVIKDTSLWRVVAFMKAIGLNPTIGKQINVPLAKIVGKHLIVTVEDGEPYPAGSTNIKSEIRGYAPVNAAAGAVEEDDTDDDDDDDTSEAVEDEDTDEEPEPEPVKKPASKAKAKPAPDDDDDDGVDVVDL